MPPTDLLDMFKQRPAKGSSPARATSRSREGASHGTSRGSDGTFGTKKRLLGGAVLTLLLALAFTAGVGVGRSSRPAPAGETLARVVKPVDLWGIRSRVLPNVGLKADDLKVKVVKELVRRWPGFSDHTYVVEGTDKNGKPTSQFRIVLKGFTSRDEAQEAASDLSLWAVEGFMPFTDSRPERMPEQKTK